LPKTIDLRTTRLVRLPAWSASPNIEIFRTLLGWTRRRPASAVSCAAPPEQAEIRFRFGAASKGTVEVRLEPQGAGMAVNITLPPETPGEFVWEDAPGTHAGVNRFLLYDLGR